MNTDSTTQIKVATKKEKKKFKYSIVKQLIFCFSITLILFLVSGICITLIQNIRYKEEVKERVEAINHDVIYEIEEIKYDSKEIKISGWIAWDDIAWESVAVVLQGIDSSEIVISKVELKERQDVKEYFETNVEMKCFGFTTIIKSNELKENICYELLVDVSYQTTDDNGLVVRPGIKISTNKYIYNGVEYVYNPLDFIKPDIDMEEWQIIFQEGRLCDYSIEHGTWIYLYEGTLYWIIDSNKIPPIDKVPSIPVLMYTNRSDLIPENQLEKYNERGYTYAEIYLTDEHYLDKDDSVYFVASYKLPTEYPMLYIQTGPYGNRDGVSWIYKGNFRVHSLEEMQQWK